MDLIQVLGTNGAGKSSLLRAVAVSVPSAHVIPLGPALGPATWCPSVGTVLIGDYLTPNRTPGADRIRGKAALLASLDAAMVLPRVVRIAWEGIILQTRQYHHEYLNRGLRPRYLVLMPALDVAFQRIEARSGHARTDLKGNGKIVAARARAVQRLGEWLAMQPYAEVRWIVAAEAEAAPASWVAHALAPRRVAAVRRTIIEPGVVV